MKKLVVLTGAGISQESGLSTFRDADGLWNNYLIEEVASPEAWSTTDPALIYNLKGWELKLGDLCEQGSQLRPHIVWFGEPVPDIITATSMVKLADVFLVIGTSLKVYPAAGLLQFVSARVPKYFIDPEAEPAYFVQNLTILKEKATAGMASLTETLLRARFLLVMWFSLVAFSQLLAQPRQDDVVYLKNGTFLRGTVIDLVPEKTVKILLNGKDTLEISMFEVKEIRKENTPERLHYEDGNKAWGYTNITELVFGFGYSEGINEAVNPAQQQGMVGLSMFNGVTITPYIQLGLGTGLEFWRNRGFLPIYLDLRTNLLKSTETPFFYVSAGYSAGWMTGEEGLGLGGAMAGIGAGAKFRINKLTMVASLGYRFQQARQWQVVYNVQSKTTIDSHFLVLKTGIFF